MGGTLWEEPIFFLIYPWTQLQNLGVKGKHINKSRLAEKGIRLSNFTEKNLHYHPKSLRKFDILVFFFPDIKHKILNWSENYCRMIRDILLQLMSHWKIWCSELPASILKRVPNVVKAAWRVFLNCYLNMWIIFYHPKRRLPGIPLKDAPLYETNCGKFNGIRPYQWGALWNRHRFYQFIPHTPNRRHENSKKQNFNCFV